MLKKNKSRIIISSIIILLPMIFGLIMWDKLPDTMTTHWGADGNADGFSGKVFAVFGLPSEVFAISTVLNTTISGFYSLDLPKHPKEYYYRFLTFFTVTCSISVVMVVGSY